MCTATVSLSSLPTSPGPRNCLYGIVSQHPQRDSSLPAPLCSQRSGLAADGRPSSTCPSPPYRHSFVYTVGVSPWCIAGAGLLCQHKLCRCRLHPCPGAALACRSILLRAQMGRQLAGTIPPSRSCSELCPMESAPQCTCICPYPGTPGSSTSATSTPNPEASGGRQAGVELATWLCAMREE